MNDAARMSAAERDQLIDQFWRDLARELDLSPELAERMRSMKATLPDDPTPAQIWAWGELVEMIRDPAFRNALRLSRQVIRRSGMAEVTRLRVDSAEAGRQASFYRDVDLACEAGEEPASAGGR